MVIKHPFVVKVLRVLARVGYSCLWCLLCPFYLIKLKRRSRKEPLYGQFILERFGFYAGPAGAKGSYIWLHAVSLGEMRGALVLVQALREQLPDMKLLLTTGTATGRAQGLSLVKDGDVLCWLPVDTPGAVKRFLKHYRPLVGMLMETEMWPNLMHYAKRENVPMVLVNARLSEKSLKGAWKARILLRPAYAALTGVLAQTDEDRRRLRIAGAHGVEVVGNLKYDMLPDAEQVRIGEEFKADVKRPVIMAASTRQGEELALLRAWQKFDWAGLLPERRPLLLLVPRHPQRFDGVGAFVQNEGLALLRRGALQYIESLCEYDVEELRQVDVFLGDSLGEMSLYYSMSEMVLLGGSFEPFGGQNLIEALACHNPVIMGAHTYNFSRPCAEAIAAGVGFRAVDFDMALGVVAKFLQQPDELLDVRGKTQEFIEKNRGASRLMSRYIARLVRARKIPSSSVGRKR